MSTRKRAPGRLAERFRRAICSDDLASAKRIAEQAMSESTDAQPFTIQNQDRFGVADSANAHGGATNIIPLDDLYSQASGERPNASRTASGSIGMLPSSLTGSGNAQKLAMLSAGATDYSAASSSYDSLRQCPGLSASQYRFAQHCRSRDRHREAGRAKSSLVLAVENGASIEMVQWLLDMGHERGRFSTDARGCTIVSLAAQHDRCDIIEACCTDAVAHAASIHHIHTVGYGQRQFMMGHDDDDEAEEAIIGSEAQDEGADDSADGPSSIPTAGPSTPRASRRPSGTPTLAPMRASSNPEVAKKSSTDWNIAMQISDDSEVDDIVGTTVQRLLDAPDELGRTALCLASMKGFLDVVRLLIDYGAAYDQADYEGNTPLHYAAAYNHLLIVQLLIERGCTFALKNAFDFTAADYAYTTSLKSALEAFARAQYEGKRVARTRAAASEATSPSPVRAMTEAVRGASGPAGRGSPAIAHRQDSSSYSTASSGHAEGLKSLLSSTSLLPLGPSRAHSTQPPSATSSSTNVASTTAASHSQPQLLRSPELAKRASPRFKQPLPW